MFYGWYIVAAGALLSAYFGTQNCGAIFGLTSIFITVGTVVSLPIAGSVYDSLGTYGPIWLILGGLALVGAIIMFILPSPDKDSGNSTYLPKSHHVCEGFII